MANTEAALNMDMGKLGWDATAVFVQYHVQHGNQPEDFSGACVESFADVDNIEAGTNTGQFFQAWLQRNSADDSVSVLAGLYARLKVLCDRNRPIYSFSRMACRLK